MLRTRAWLHSKWYRYRCLALSIVWLTYVHTLICARTLTAVSAERDAKPAHGLQAETVPGDVWAVKLARVPKVVCISSSQHEINLRLSSPFSPPCLGCMLFYSQLFAKKYSVFIRPQIQNASECIL